MSNFFLSEPGYKSKDRGLSSSSSFFISSPWSGGVSHSMRQTKLQSFDGTLSHSLWLCQDHFISVYSGGPHCALPLCSCISFASPLFRLLLEMNWRYWFAAKAGIRTTLACFRAGGLVPKRGWANTILFEYVLLTLHNNAVGQKLWYLYFYKDKLHYLWDFSSLTLEHTR